MKPKIATWVLLKQSEGETKSEIEGKSVVDGGEGGGRERERERERKKLAFYL